VKKFNILNILVLGTLILSSLASIGCDTRKTYGTTQVPGSTQETSVIEEVKWNLSEAVMPTPEFGSQDIPGSEIDSTLTVDQTEAQLQITGDMSGLNKNTSYTVFFAKGYTIDTGYPGLFTNKVAPFAFITDTGGVYNWTFIVPDADFPGPGTYALSIWVSETGSNTTVLISDIFNVTIK
jgi:hypothetical protein